MAAVRSLGVSVKPDSGSDRSHSDSDSDRDTREAEPMEVEEGELEAEVVSVNRSLKELLPVRTSQAGDWSCSCRALAPSGWGIVSAAAARERSRQAGGLALLLPPDRDGQIWTLGSLQQ